MYIASLTMVKLSLYMFFLGIFSIQKIQRFIIYVMFAETVAYGITYLVFTAATCGAVSGLLGAASCAEWKTYSYISYTWSGLNAFSDFVLAALSCHALYVSQMALRVKATALCVLLLGTVGGIASIIRLVELDRGGQSNVVDGLRAGTWTLIELGISMSAASLACLRPLLRAFGKKWHPSTRSQVTTTANGRASGTFGTHNFGKSGIRVDRSHAIERDWTDDAISADEEKCTPKAPVMTSSITMQVPAEEKVVVIDEDRPTKTTDETEVPKEESKQSIANPRLSRQSLSRLSVAREWMKF